MKEFKHMNALTIDDAALRLESYKGKAKIIAGGTDLLGQMKDDILLEYPEVLVNIKTIPDLDYIREQGGTLKIGALTRIEDIAKHKTVEASYTALADAAHRVASPHIREMGTIAGNICQSNRCWYFWVPDNRFNCMRKGGKTCYAMTGDNRYHSIFGATRIGSPPCSSSCPTNVDIASYLSKIRDGDLLGAAKILLNFNPIPAITGRVCPHFCEQGCNRGEFDEPISVAAIERFIGDYILDNAEIIKAPEVESDKKVAIVGSGPAGLSAAYYLRTLGYDVTVFEKMEEPGGLLTYGIAPYRLPKAVVKKQIKALEGAGIKFRVGLSIGKHTTVEELGKTFDAVFLACGAWKEKTLGIEGEKLMGSGLQFLRNVNLGNKEIPGKEVAVIGGGNTAMEVARTLLRIGAEPVVIYRRSEVEMPAARKEVEKAQEEGVKFEFLTQPTEVRQKNRKRVLSFVRMQLGPLDETGRPRPLPIEGSQFTTKFDSVIKAIGERPDTSHAPEEFLDNRGQLKIDHSAYFMGRNFFAGGDFVTGPSTVVESIAAGRKAANSIARYFEDRREEFEDHDTTKLPLKFNNLDLGKTSRVSTPELSISEGPKSIHVEDVLGLNLREVEMEANRCFNCGCLAVSPSDVAPALIALNAKIRTTKRVIEAEQFFAVEGEKSTVLRDDEIVTEIQVPKPKNGTKSKFIKFALRKSIDFPIANCAGAIQNEEGIVKSARICLNAVYNTPYRATEAEKFIVGKPIDDSTAEAAGNAAIAGACSLTSNSYKIQIAKTLVKRTILACK